MNVALSIGKKIKDRRETKRISQNELARLLGISPAAVCQWERKGTIPRAKTLSKVAQALGVSEEYLTGAAPTAPAEAVEETVPRAKTLSKVAQALGVSEQYLTGASAPRSQESVAAYLEQVKARIAESVGVETTAVRVEITISY